MKVKLTDSWIRGAPADKRRNVTDAACPGLMLRLTPGGVRTFAVLYRARSGKNRTLTLGRWPEVSLADARERTREVRARVRLGEDPAAEAARPAAVPDDLGALLGRFIAARRSHLSDKTASGYEGMVKSYLGDLAARPAASVVRGDVRELLERTAKERGDTTANRLHQFLRASFRWAEREEVLPRNPIAGMQRPRRERRLTAEERCLSDEEVVRLWNARGTSAAEHAYAKTMLLCGTRRNETALARWRDVDLDAGTWALPPENRKGARRGLVVPLAPLAVQVLRGLGPGEPDEPVFGRVLANPDRVVKRLRKASGVKFDFHDLRATCATGCAEAGAPPHVVALVLGHVGVPGVPSVTSLYDRGDRTPEVRSALAAWAARVERLVSGAEPARVVAWRRG